MKWTAHVTSLTARPQDSKKFNLIGFDADSEFDAARWATEASAKALYGPNGVASFINANVSNAPLYRASIGMYHNGVTKGCSLDILVMRYSHPVTGK